MQGKLADMYTTMNACSGLCVRRGARPATAAETTRKDCGRQPSSIPPKRPRRWRLTRSRLLGGNGYINDYPTTGRLLRDAKLYEIGAGTSEVRRMLIGREMMAETA